MQDFSEVIADNPNNIIDMINPQTGLTVYCGETLEQVRLRYPEAEQMSWAEFQTRKAAMQDRPIEWDATTKREYRDMLEVLPPAYWEDGVFLVGEASDHHWTGVPRFQGYREVGGVYTRASRPMTIKEAQAIVAPELLPEVRAEDRPLAAVAELPFSLTPPANDGPNAAQIDLKLGE